MKFYLVFALVFALVSLNSKVSSDVIFCHLYRIDDENLIATAEIYLKLIKSVACRAA